MVSSLPPDATACRSGQSLMQPGPVMGCYKRGHGVFCRRANADAGILDIEIRAVRRQLCRVRCNRPAATRSSELVSQKSEVEPRSAGVSGSW